MNIRTSLLFCTTLLLCYALHSVEGVSVQGIQAQTGGDAQAFLSSTGPVNAVEIILISWAPTPISLRVYSDAKGKNALTMSGTGVSNNTLTLNSREAVKITSKSRIYVHMGSNKSNMEHPDVQQIGAQLKDQRNDRNWLYPEQGGVYGIYYNHKGLVPGLLKGVGYDKDRTPTIWGKLCGIEIVDPKGMKKNKTQAEASVGQTVSTLDKVLKFEQAVPKERR